MRIRDLLTPTRAPHDLPWAGDNPIFAIRSLRHSGRKLFVRRQVPGQAGDLSLPERTMLALATVHCGPPVVVRGPRQENAGPFVVSFDEEDLRHLARSSANRRSV